MKANYTETFITDDGTVFQGPQKTVELPFSRVSVRAVIVRRKDGAIIGTLHHQNGRYALPGGGTDDGENTEETIVRELHEENITLMGSDGDWRRRIITDYFHGYRELAVWYVFVVEDAVIESCEENVETRWVQQIEDVWYPFMRERLLLALQVLIPELVRQRVSIST